MTRRDALKALSALALSATAGTALGQLAPRRRLCRVVAVHGDTSTAVPVVTTRAGYHEWDEAVVGDPFLCRSPVGYTEHYRPGCILAYDPAERLPQLVAGNA